MGLGSKLGLSGAGRIVLAIAPSSTSTLYASIANVADGAQLGFYKTTDGGANWTALKSTPDYCTPQCSYDNVIAVQPTNPDVVYARRCLMKPHWRGRWTAAAPGPSCKPPRNSVFCTPTCMP